MQQSQPKGRSAGFGKRFFRAVLRLGIFLFLLFRRVIPSRPAISSRRKGSGGRLRQIKDSVFQALRRPIAVRVKRSDLLYQALREAKEKHGFARVSAVLYGVSCYLFGERGPFATVFNYALPLLCIGFAVSLISYAASLQCAISVSYNGQELGVVSEKGDYELAMRVVEERISAADDVEDYEIQPDLSLTVVEYSTDLISAMQLADNMLASTHATLCEAWGIYIGGTFFCATEDKSAIEESLSLNLSKFEAPGGAEEIRYQDTITYQQGLYLSESLRSTWEIIEQLTQKETELKTYYTADGDTLYRVAQLYGMDLDSLLALNPDLNPEEDCQPSTPVTVSVETRYLPIQYTMVTRSTTYIDYDVVEVETSSLSVGSTEVLVPGERGEKSNLIHVTYVDHMEVSRQVVSSKITKQPVSEQLGVGTYSAKPSSASTVLRGTGQLSWPVNGGYISDPYGSDRNHKGMDIAAPAGTEIYAAAEGEVVAAGWNSGGYGYCVVIDHGDGLMTVYGHCSMVWAVAGQKVTRGQLIASVGSTGDSSGNHLHFEVRTNGILQDPAGFLRVNAD